MRDKPFVVGDQRGETFFSWLFGWFLIGVCFVLVYAIFGWYRISVAVGWTKPAQVYRGQQEADPTRKIPRA